LTCSPFLRSLRESGESGRFGERGGRAVGCLQRRNLRTITEGGNDRSALCRLSSPLWDRAELCYPCSRLHRPERRHKSDTSRGGITCFTAIKKDGSALSTRSIAASLTRLTYAAAPAFVARGAGTIINIASVVGIASTGCARPPRWSPHHRRGRHHAGRDGPRRRLRDFQAPSHRIAPTQIAADPSTNSSMPATNRRTREIMLP
jgi:hypothetical protein